MANNYTRDSIKHAFMDLLNEHPMSKISVKSIVDACNISRNTFYYHFKDVPDVLESVITGMADKLIEEHPSLESMDECLDKVFAYAKKNRRAIYHIYHSVDREVYEDFLMKMCSHTAKVMVKALLNGREMPEEKSSAVTRFIKCQLFGICIDWTRSDLDDDIAESYRQMTCTVMRFFDEVMEPDFDITGNGKVTPREN